MRFAHAHNLYIRAVVCTVKRRIADRFVVAAGRDQRLPVATWLVVFERIIRRTLCRLLSCFTDEDGAGYCPVEVGSYDSLCAG